jgi:hypothetical protein
MKPSILRTKLLSEINLIPEEKLEELYSYRLFTTTSVFGDNE